jgi:hypothetical protein
MSIQLQRLSDEEILRIFDELQRSEANKPQAEQDVFLTSYAETLRLATRRDFLILRGTSLILIGKYNLGSYLEARSA